MLGRDPLCDLTLRAGGVSRQHAEISRGPDPGGGGTAFLLRDLDSRNGTSLRGLPLAGRVPLVESGRFALGDECQIDYELAGGALILRIPSGLDRGLALIAGEDGQRLELAPLGIPLDVVFQRGRPLLGRGRSREVKFNDEPLGEVRVQLIRGDRLFADGDEIEVG